MSDQEKIVGREFGKILKIGFQREDQDILRRLDELENLTNHADNLAILRALKEIVPEFVPVESRSDSFDNNLRPSGTGD